MCNEHHQQKEHSQPEHYRDMFPLFLLNLSLKDTHVRKILKLDLLMV